MILDFVEINNQRTRYQVFCDGVAGYTFFRDSNLEDADLRLLDKTGSCRAVIKNFSSILKTFYQATFQDGSRFKFVSQSILRGHFRGEHLQDIYDIYAHPGSKYSVYKNNEQVAWWDSMTAFHIEKKRYRAITNDSIGLEILIVICLVVIDRTPKGGPENALTIDLGNMVLFPAKKFNRNWHP